MHPRKTERRAGWRAIARRESQGLFRELFDGVNVKRLRRLVKTDEGRRHGAIPT
jgi:hypothetical protein